MASPLFPCGLQLKQSLQRAAWQLVVSLPEVYLSSKHHQQEGAAESSVQVLPMVQPTYLVEPQLGQGGLVWVESKVFPHHPPGVNFHSLPEGEGFNVKLFNNAEKLSHLFLWLEMCCYIEQRLLQCPEYFSVFCL